MRFFQRYSYDEDSLGSQAVLFVVSDNYEELFNDLVGTETDIFMLESVKKDLNTEEGSFAIDELPFSINHLACETDNDVKAMFFCLNATDIKYQRYCALFMNTNAVLADMDFIGKIHNKVSGTDKIWQSGEYGFDVNAFSEYKFSAYSFDISVIEQCSFNGSIEQPDGTPIDNVYERFEAETFASIKAIFLNRKAYALDLAPDTKVARFCKLGSLFPVIQRYLELAQEIILELTGTDIDLVLVESSLGIRTLPQKYEFVSPYRLPISKFSTDPDRIKELKLSATESGADWSNPFIHRRMIDASLGAPKTTPTPPETPQFVNDYQQTQYSKEAEYSFRKLDNVAELLYEIARAFACYLFVAHGTGNQINFEFKSREALVEADYTYIIGAKTSEFDTSSILSKDGNQFYGNSGAYAIDFDTNTDSPTYGFDKVGNKHNTSEALVSELYSKRESDKRAEKERTNVDSRRLMLTTSPTRLHLSATNLNEQFPLNIVGVGDYFDPSPETSWDYHNFVGGGYSADVKWNNFIREYLHTGIYVKSTASELDQIALLGDYPIWRPASQIIVKINGVNKDFNTLSEYCNYVMSRDIQYYETEYNLVIPYWNGFSKFTDGSSPSWKNIKLGSKVKLFHTIQKWDGLVWTENEIESEYIVVGIERNLQKPETKLKLHNLERFSFGTWDDPTPPPVFSFTPNLLDVNTFDESDVSTYVLIDVSSPDIAAGDAVQIKPDGSIMKAWNKAEYYHYPLGIALTAGSGGDTIPIQRTGRVVNSGYSFTEAGKVIQVRYSAVDSNVSTTLLAESNANENVIMRLGESDGPTSFFIDIMKLGFQ